MANLAGSRENAPRSFGNDDLFDGSVSIRYKYRAKIWDQETKIMNQIFTFDAKGNFVSVKNVDGFPQDP